MRILTVCSAGNNRSVCAGYLLKHQYKHDSIAVGADAAKPETMGMLCAWAERILICGEPGLATRVPETFRHKVTQLNIGPDKWSPSYHPELMALMKSELAKVGLP